MERNKLRVSRKSTGEIDMIAVWGPVDSSNLDYFTNLLSSLVDKRRVKAILDCRGISYMNYRALKLIQHYQRVAVIKMGRLAVVGLSSSLLKAYRSPQVQEARIFDKSIEQALAELKPLLAA